MVDSGPDVACRSFLPPSANRTCCIISTAVLALGLWVYIPAANTAEQSAAPHEPEEDYGEHLARPEELATVSVNRIVRSLRLNAQAMTLGKKVYARSCAECHGADLKGIPEKHTPDLTDAEWRFAGDDLQSGGLTKFPSDVEWTVRYGIRSEHPNTRGAEADMLAYDPQYRNEEDKKDFGDGWFLTLEEIDDVVEYVLQISGQRADAGKAARGDVLFHDGAKGNCYDCLVSLRLRPRLDPRVDHQGASWGHAGLRGQAQARGYQGGVGLRLLSCRKMKSSKIAGGISLPCIRSFPRQRESERTQNTDST